MTTPQRILERAVRRGLHQEQTTSIPTRLSAAYLRTEFVVDLMPPLVMRVGKRSARRDRLLTERGHATWAFVTAWNPWSQPRSRLTNQARHRRLRTALARMGLPCVAGRGRDPRGRWPAEESFFVMGCSVSEARRLGSVFGQHAVLVGRLGGRPRLLACAAPAI